MRRCAARSARRRWRLVRSILVDQAALAAIGGAMGLALAAFLLRLFVTTAPVSIPRVQDVVIDARVVLFALGAALLAAVAVALLPAWRLGRGDLESVLRSGGERAIGGGQRMRAALLTAQVALSVHAAAASGLFLSSLARLLRVDTGFTAENASTVEIAPVTARYPDTPQRAALYDRILERVRTIPSVEAASWTSALPLTGETWVDAMMRPDRPGADTTKMSANYRFVGPEYFRAIGIPILKGRSIERADRTRTPIAAVVSARAARTMWPGENPVGREFTRANPDEHLQVVGVVPDGRVTAIESEPPLMVYVPYWYNNEGKSVLVLRTRGEPAGVSRRRATRRARRGSRHRRRSMAPLRHIVDAAVEGRRYQASLFTAFGGVALLIAILGVYATTVYGISRRRREMNIRVALGARVSQVSRLVLRQSLSPVVVGLAGGLVGRARHRRRDRKPALRDPTARSVRPGPRHRGRCGGGIALRSSRHAIRPPHRAGRGAARRIAYRPSFSRIDPLRLSTVTWGPPPLTVPPIRFFEPFRGRCRHPASTPDRRDLAAHRGNIQRGRAVHVERALEGQRLR